MRGPIIALFAAATIFAAPTRLIIDGDEGSHLIGSTETTTVTLQTTLGSKELVLNTLREINIDDDVSSITLTDGKRLAGKLLIDSLTISTIIGDIRVPTAHIRRVQILSGDVFNGLLLHYSFDADKGERIEDSVGDAHARAKGSSVLAEGRLGAARQFSGEPQHIVLPEATVSGMREGSIATWIRLPKTSNQQIFNRCVEEEDIHVQFRTGDRGNLAAFLGPYATSISVRSQETIPANTWTHIALTWNGSEADLYQNGKRVAHLEDPEERLLVPLIHGSFWIGRDTRKAYPGQTLRGDLDEFMVFRRTLFELDIQSLFAYYTKK
jgi:hypothetical protein